MVFIDNIDVDWPADSLYEGGDINYTITSLQNDINKTKT